MNPMLSKMAATGHDLSKLPSFIESWCEIQYNRHALERRGLWESVVMDHIQGCASGSGNTFIQESSAHIARLWGELHDDDD